MHQIQLANAAFEGRNSVYLLGADDPAAPTTLVDTGVSVPDVDEELRASLAERGVAYADVDQVVLTHWHYDHAGLAGAVQAASGATVFVGAADAPLVEQDDEALAAVEDRQEAYFDAWGMPEGKRDELREFFETTADFRGEPIDATPVSDGDAVTVGDLTLRAVHLPGHAAGLTAFAFEREGRREAFVGDAILPKYTPNVGGADVRVEAPLERYLDSLDRVVDLDLDRAWPGHRGAIFAPSRRARDIAEHHRERAERVLGVVRGEGPVTAWEVSAALFGDLRDIHVLHGPGEAYAHLDHLERRGILERAGRAYAVTDGVTREVLDRAI